MEQSKVIFDKDKLGIAVKNKGYTNMTLSRMMGYNDSFIRNIIGRGCSMRIGDYKLMCAYLGVSEDELKPAEKSDNPNNIQNCDEFKKYIDKAFQDLTKFVDYKIGQLRTSVDKLENATCICRENTNIIKIQNERLKEAINALRLDMNDAMGDIAGKIDVINSISGAEELRKAKAMLAKMLNDGPKEENEIYLEAQKQQVAKKYVDRAKNELGVLVETKGYTNNKTKKWFFG